MKRRGVASAAVIVMLGLVNLLVIGAVRPGGEEALAALERVESARALHAAESGMRIVLQLMSAGHDGPVEGDVLSLGGATIEFIRIPAGEQGEIVVEGAAGSARRRVSAIVH